MLGDPRPGVPGGLLVQAAAGPESHKCRLQRITHRTPPGPLLVGGCEGRVVAEQAGAGQPAQLVRYGHRCPLTVHGAVRGVTDAGDREPGAVPGDRLLHGHPSLGEGAGLVRGDHGDRTKCLHSVQPAGDRPGRGHPAGAERQGQRHHCGQRLRHRGHHQAHRGDRHLPKRSAVEQADEEDQPGQRHGGEGEDATEGGETALQRSGRRPGGGRQGGDPAQRARRSGADHRAGGPAGGHHGAGAGLLARRATHRHRLAGQRRLVQVQPARVVQQQVGRDHVAGLDPDQVAPDQFGGGQHHVPAVADHPGGRRGELVERGDGLVGAYFLDHPDHGVDRDHQQDHRRVGVVPQRRGDHGRGEQERDQRVGELTQDPGGQVSSGRRGGGVGPVDP